MEKILVGIHIAAADLRYDAFVPSDLRISQLAAVIAQGVSELTDGKYERSGLEMLSLKDPECLFDPSLTLADYRIKDGTQLYLI